MKKLLILSGKGGTGKTTVAAALIGFSGVGAVGDCDVDAPNLHLIVPREGEIQRKDFYGGKKAQVKPLTCVGCGECLRHCRFGAIELKHDTARVDPIACEGCGVCQLVCPTHAVRLVEDVAGELTLFLGSPVFSGAELKMGRGNSGKLVTEVKFALYGAAKQETLAIIDGSPGIGCPVIASISGVDLALIVAEPSVSGISDLRRLLQTAEGLGVAVAVCVNKFDVNMEKTEEIEALCGERGIPLVGKIPFDDAVGLAIREGRSVHEKESRAKDALYEIYQKTMLLLEEPKSIFFEEEAKS